MKKSSAVFYGSLLLVINPLVASESMANDINDPFRSANRNPFVQIYGLPVAQGASVTTQGKWQAAINLEASNNFAAEQSANEAIFIDGETYRADVSWRYGLLEGLDIGLSIPYISHKGGGIDKFIEDWHDLFGFPDGDRVDYERDQLRYAYQRNGQSYLDMSDRAEGKGDVSLSAAYQLSTAELRQWALRGGVKFATGDVETLHGSDANDSYLSLHVSDQHLLSDHKLVLHASAGALWLGDGDVLPEQQEDVVWFGSGTVSWAYSENVSFKTQLDMHTAFYDSGLKQIGDTSVQWILGSSIKIAKNGYLDLSISEDLAVETAPDVVFQIGIRVGEW